jgi:hypothetical protein
VVYNSSRGVSGDEEYVVWGTVYWLGWNDNIYDDR